LYLIGPVLLACISTTHAHSLGESYLFFKVYNDRIEGRVEVTVSDLDKAVGLDENRDGVVSINEVDSRIDQIQAYITHHLRIGVAKDRPDLRHTTHEILDVVIGRYAVLHFVANFPDGVPDLLAVEYSCLFDSDPEQRGLLLLEWNDKTQTKGDETSLVAVFQPGQIKHDLDLTDPFKSAFLTTFIRHGIRHIWIGIDHILFLLAFVLQTVVILKDKRWQPVANFWPAFVGAVKIVTLFTIAHSITLSLAVLNIVNLPSRFVESVIAASVVIAASNAILPFMGNHIGYVIFGFGLFHGFGFASVLGHLGLQSSSIAIPLLGFNLGVEIGQVAIICVSIPLCYLLSRSKMYPGVILKGSSAIIMLIALVWFIERAFALDPILT